MEGKEPIRLRKKKLKNGAYSLYLDYYINGKRSFEFLKLYLNPGNDASTRQLNKNALEAAKTIQAKRIIQYQEGKAGIVSSDKRQMKMLDWMDRVIDMKSSLDKNYIQTLAKVRSIWSDFAGPNVRVCDIDEDMLRAFAKYMDNLRDSHHDSQLNRQMRKGACREATPEDITRQVIELVGKGVSQRETGRMLGLSRSTVATIWNRHKKVREPKPLTPTTKSIYFARLGTFLNKAVKAGIIPYSPMTNLEPSEKPRATQVDRQYLTMDELVRLAETECRFDVVKRMFLFSCFTGLRFSDARAVTWKMVDSGSIAIRMDKTDKFVYVPLSGNALRWLPERKDETVFSDCPALGTVDREIHKWVERAGIDKNISFHCSRHTFATLLITSGADLYTVSQLLGHTNITTTQIYAKIIDKKKEDAVNLIPEMK